MTVSPDAEAPAIVSVPIGRWAVAREPVLIRTLLGSCVGIALHDPACRVGGVAHVVLPESPGSADHPGKYADTAIPAMIEDLDRLRGPRPTRTLVARIAGGASMFQAGASLAIGPRNVESVEKVLRRLGIAVDARDVGGEAGRRLTLDTASGLVAIRIPGGADYTL
jgi:chemotaxis protein CheD